MIQVRFITDCSTLFFRFCAENQGTEPRARGRLMAEPQMGHCCQNWRKRLVGVGQKDKKTGLTALAGVALWIEHGL